jgi:hypothetical protein
MAKRVPYIFAGESDHHMAPTASKTSSRWSFIAPIFAALALVLLAQGSALAVSNFMTLFNNKYGTSGTVLNDCSVCHAPIPVLNPYGEDFINAGGGDAALDAIANVDSDGDGAINITEINARTFPGDPASIPAPPPPTGLPVPGVQSVISYEAVISPLISPTAETARPVGLGQVAAGGTTVNVSLGLAPTSGPVDVYFGLQINGGAILLLTSAGQFQSISAGVVPLFAGSTGNFNQSLFGAINVSALPSGTYTFYMMVTPAGSLANFYLYITGFTITGAP